MEEARVRGEHLDADTVVSLHVVGVRAKTSERDQACLAHPRWMSREQLAELVDVASTLLERWDS